MRVSCPQATLRQKALLVCHNIKDFPNNDEPQTGYIDVWWIKHDGGLLLLISHLLQKHRVWRRCDLRLHLITEMGTDPQQLKDRVHKLLRTHSPPHSQTHARVPDRCCSLCPLCPPDVALLVVSQLLGCPRETTDAYA
jgi:hypothetical protein